jgi:hypothetical protein
MRRVLRRTFDKWNDIGRALDCIPPQGHTIEKKHYENFFWLLDKSVQIKKGISFASRLLCLKRPDVFVSVTKTNRPKLTELFGKNITTRESYWAFIENVQKSKWYQEAPRSDKLFHCRMALLDVVSYNT